MRRTGANWRNNNEEVIGCFNYKTRLPVPAASPCAMSLKPRTQRTNNAAGQLQSWRLSHAKEVLCVTAIISAKLDS